MSNETKSRVMKRAWEIKKEDERNLFSECLKIAWVEIKGYLKYKMMIPTRKQVGVIYAAFKKGLVNVAKEVISDMYTCLNAHERAVDLNEEDFFYNHCAIIGQCVNAAFDGNYAFVERELEKIA